MCLVELFCNKLVSCFLAVSSFGGNLLIFGKLFCIARYSVSSIHSLSSEFESANIPKSRSYFNIKLTADTLFQDGYDIVSHPESVCNGKIFEHLFLS